MASLFAAFVNGKSVGHFMAEESTAPGIALTRAHVLGFGDEVNADGTPRAVRVDVQPAHLMGRRIALYTRRK